MVVIWYDREAGVGEVVDVAADDQHRACASDGAIAFVAAAERVVGYKPDVATAGVRVSSHLSASSFGSIAAMLSNA